jgi:putative membrane protein
VPQFHPHLDVIGLVLALVVGYVFALQRLGPVLAPRRGEPVYERKHIVRFVLAITLIFSFSYWPVHDWSEDYLFSVHMVQHTVYSLIAPPILLMSLPPWMLDWITSAPWLRTVLRKVCRPLPAALMFNGITAISHWPAWVDLSLRSEWFHFAAHAILWATSSAMWLPVVNPGVAGLPALSRMAKMPYLFLQSIVPTIPASFLAWAEQPFYQGYISAPRITSMSAIEDQQLAGGIMKVGGTMIIWTVITVIFFRWYADSERTGRDTLTWEEVETEFERVPPAKKEITPVI